MKYCWIMAIYTMSFADIFVEWSIVNVIARKKKINKRKNFHPQGAPSALKVISYSIQVKDIDVIPAFLLQRIVFHQQLEKEGKLENHMKEKKKMKEKKND